MIVRDRIAQLEAENELLRDQLKVWKAVAMAATEGLPNEWPNEINVPVPPGARITLTRAQWAEVLENARK